MVKTREVIINLRITEFNKLKKIAQYEMRTIEDQTIKFIKNSMFRFWRKNQKRSDKKRVKQMEHDAKLIQASIDYEAANMNLDKLSE